MPGFVGPWELILLGVILFALFGASRMPSLGRQLGRGAREAKKNVQEVKHAVGLEELREADGEEKGEAKSQLPPLTPKAALRRMIDS